MTQRMSQSEAIGYMRGLLESQTEAIKGMNVRLDAISKDVIDLKKDAEFRRKIKKGIIYTATTAAAVFGAVKVGDFSKIWPFLGGK